MNREELEEKGWEFSRDDGVMTVFKKGDIWKGDGQGAWLQVREGKIKIETTDKRFNQNGPIYSVKYYGNCNNMEEFDMICKMIELKA